MSGNYQPIVAGKSFQIQTASESRQIPFFFGGSQVPTALNLPRNKISGQGMAKQIKPYAKNLIKLYLPK